MEKYLRIRNRRACLRTYFQFLGATTKRDDDESDGFFGTGSKLAGIAALNLDIPVFIASHDESGPYLFSYQLREIAFGPLVKNQVIMAFDDGSTLETSFLDDAAPDWTKPIGDDPIRSVRVLGEFLQNAKDAEPINPAVCDVDKIGHAPEGETHVFIGLNEEIVHMRKHPERYFKFISKQRPLFTKPGIGSVYEKSEAGVTRLFGRGRIAYCESFSLRSTAFDYSLRAKPLMAGDRTFADMTDVEREIFRLLMNLDDASLAERILKESSRIGAQIEVMALSNLAEDEEVPAAAAWREAWKRVYDDAVLTCGGPQPDEIASVVVKRKVIHPASHSLTAFLRRCGVPDALSVLPKSEEGEGWRELPFSVGGRRRLDLILPKMLIEFPDMADVRIRSFLPLIKAARNYGGFVPKNPDGTMKREACIRWDVFMSNRKLAIVLQHEFRHIRTGANDATREFEHQADDDWTDLFMEKHGIKDDDVKPKLPSE